MLKRIRKSMEEKDQGFTLIELLVVMIIIGILAAIAVPVFLSQRSKAQDTAAKSDVSILGKEIATYWVDGSAIPTVVTNASAIVGPPAIPANHYIVNSIDVGKVSTNNSLVSNYGATTAATSSTASMAATTSTTWCIAVYNTNSKNYFKYSAQNGLESGNCTSAVLP